MGIIVLATIAAAVTGGTYFMGQIIQNYQPGSRRVQQDVLKLEADAKKNTAALIPISAEELDLLSLKLANKTEQSRFGKSGDGLITSVYQEHLGAYAYRKYMSPQLNAVIVAITSQSKFLYRLKGDDTTIVYQDKVVGILDNKGRFLTPDKKGIIAEIKFSRTKAVICVGEREIAMVAIKPEIDSPHPRAFDLVEPKEENEKLIILLLTFLLIIKKELET